MNYDKTEIPTTYDKARALVPETLRLWQNLLSVYVDQAEMSLVIDLGCGTGRFSELLAAHFGVQVIGIDPSLKMLDQARRKPTMGNVAYWQGSAEALPLRNGCADLVFMSMAYHHLTDPTAVSHECHRVLRQGGYVCIRNGTRRVGLSTSTFLSGTADADRFRSAVTTGHRDRIRSGRLYACRASSRDAGYRHRLAELH